MHNTLYYFHDPMCSWCYGYRPTWKALRENLPASIKVINVLGGLAPDSDEPMPDQMKDYIQGCWRRINSELGAEFNFDFWKKCRPRRSTYPACRAVIAAANQGNEEAMIVAIQDAYYRRAMNPSDLDTLIRLAEELALDVNRFAEDLKAEATEQTLQQQLRQTRTAPVSGFPSLVLEREGHMSPVMLDYHDYKVSLAMILDHGTRMDAVGRN